MPGIAGESFSVTTLEVLADPVRLRIVRRLEGNGTASLPQLAQAAGVHRNTLRPHVEQLEEAGLLVRVETQPAGRGRPPVRYQLDDGWTPPTSGLQGLAELLAAAVVRMQPEPQASCGGWARTGAASSPDRDRRSGSLRARSSGWASTRASRGTRWSSPPVRAPRISWPARARMRPDGGRRRRRAGGHERRCTRDRPRTRPRAALLPSAAGARGTAPVS